MYNIPSPPPQDGLPPCLPGLAAEILTLKIARHTIRFRGITPRMIERTAHLRALTALLRQFPVVAILGPRQIGKTTLARQFLSRRGGRATLFDLESARTSPSLRIPCSPSGP